MWICEIPCNSKVMEYTLPKKSKLNFFSRIGIGAFIGSLLNVFCIVAADLFHKFLKF